MQSILPRVLEIQNESSPENETQIGHDDDNNDAMKVEGSIHRLCTEKLRKLLPTRQNIAEKATIDALVKNLNEKKKIIGDFELVPTSEQDSHLLRRVLPTTLT